MHWIIQNNLVKREVVDAIVSALQEDAVSYEEVFVIPFSEELPGVKNVDAHPLFYGSTTLIMNAYNDKKFSRGVFYNAETFTIENYLSKWKLKMLNHDARITTFDAFSKENFAEDSEWFVRPNEDTKSFSGAVMTFAEIRELSSGLKDSNNPHLNESSVISVSTPKVIEKEWRNFIVDGKVISSSRYMLNGELNISVSDIPEDLITFVETCCDEYRLHDVFVMDAALSNGRYYIIECNCFNGTGFYNHDIRSIVKAVNVFYAAL